MVRRLVILVIIAGLVAGGTWYYMNKPHTPLTLTGIVTTDDVLVSSQVAGRLQEMKVKQGDPVKKGELLALIKPEQWQADMAFYEQAEKQAEMQVNEAEASLRYQDEQTQSQITQAQANLAAAVALITQTQADLENARLVFSRSEDAYKRGAESAQSYDQARTAYDAVKARLDAVKKQKDAADAAVAVAQSQQQQVDMRRAAVDTAKHQLAAATAQKDKARVLLGYTEIRAPVDGIVDVRAAREGEVVPEGQPIVTLINPEDLWVRVDVEETYIDRIKINDKFLVRLPSGDEREGVVFYRAIDGDYATQRDVSRSKRDIRTFEVRLRCNNKDRALAVGMTAYITLPAPLVQDVVPSPSVAR